MLVGGHLRVASPQAAGIAKLPACASSFAATQAAWRFLNNERVTIRDMAVPIRDMGRQAANQSSSPFVLAIHDWMKIACGTHSRKKDLAQLTHEQDVGYELYSCLMVDGQSGIPLAPMEFRLETGSELHHTQDPRLVDDVWHIDQVTSVMRSSQSWGITKPILHVIDREGDSIGHYRQWAGEGELFLVRSEDRCVKWVGEERRFSSIVRSLLRANAFEIRQQINFRGKQHELRVAETSVVLHRPAQPRRNGKQMHVSGDPLPVRLIISRVYDPHNRLIAEWYLISNAPETIHCEQLAYSYYWRWRIETFFKLLKSSGFEIEHWRQETGHAIAKRLLVAAMACVVIWQLERNDSSESTKMKTLLVKLSGRQMKRKRPFTAPAMLAGLEKLIPFLEILETHTIAELRSLAKKTLPPQLINFG
jgi:hypothetical protein